MLESHDVPIHERSQMPRVKGNPMSYEKAQATQEFSRWSGGYDRSILQWLLFGPAHRAILTRLRARFGDRPTAILDVGCGTGVFAARIATALPRSTIWGVDLVNGMLTGGHERWQALRDQAVPVQGDGERLPFPDEAFDVVTCANSFHHYPHQDRAVAEMYRVLKPGGRLFLLDGCRDSLWGWFIYDVCVTAVEGEVRHVSGRDVRDLFQGAGFIQMSQRVYHGPAPFLLTEGVTGPARTAGGRPWAGVTATSRTGVMTL
jgi:ubiquinone/menaquinone biosynthesis C-methylase UbiE